jgi:hypothetical protein
VAVVIAVEQGGLVVAILEEEDNVEEEGTIEVRLRGHLPSLYHSASLNIRARIRSS